MTRHLMLCACLAPLLGATSSLARAGVTALCCVALVLSHQALMHPLRTKLTGRASSSASLVLAAALGSCLQLGLNAWGPPLAQGFEHYPALIALQCLAIERLLTPQHRWRAIGAGLASVVGACLALGVCRQVLTSLGMHAASSAWGALILLGLLLALYNRLYPLLSPSRRQGNL